MRCVACNVELNDYESTRKDSEGRFLDMCNHCFRAGEYEFDTNDRLDLLEESDIVYENNSSETYNDEIGY
jgi:hypothetical protein